MNVATLRTWAGEKFGRWVVDMGYEIEYLKGYDQERQFLTILCDLVGDTPIGSGLYRGVRDMQFRVWRKSRAIDTAVLIADALGFVSPRERLEAVGQVSRTVTGIFYVNTYRAPGKGYRHLKKWMKAAHDNVGTTGGER